LTNSPGDATLVSAIYRLTYSAGRIPAVDGDGTILSLISISELARGWPAQQISGSKLPGRRRGTEISAADLQIRFAAVIA